MTSVSSLTAVVAGTGFIGPVHVEALRRIGVQVRGILGSTQEKTTAACRELGLPHVYPSFEEVLADPSVDVVHLATPNQLHYEQAKAVLLAGKHVLCEKPLAMNSRADGGVGRVGGTDWTCCRRRLQHSLLSLVS